MDAKHISKFTHKYAGKIFLFGIVGMFIGLAVFVAFPQKYVATGLLFVTRSRDALPELGDFSYDGYYSQQNSTNYTSTVIGFLESDVLFGEVLKNQSTAVTRDTLRKLGRAVSVKKRAPQLVLVNVLGSTPEEAQQLWTSLTDEAIKTGERLNTQSDPNLYITKVAPEPLVKQTYSNIAINVVVGFGLGLLAGTFTFAVLTYLDPKS